MATAIPTPLRIVARDHQAPRAWYAADAQLRTLTEDRTRAFLFPTHHAARAAIVAACDGDPVLCGGWRVARPTVEDEARAYVDPAAR